MTSTVIIALVVAVTVICVLAARRMAISRARTRTGWMLSAALLGPLPLLALAALPVRNTPRA